MDSERLHIVHYTNVYKPMKNGVVSSVESFRKGQLRQGHSVYVVAPGSRDRSYVQERFVFNIAAITLPNQEYPFALPYDPTLGEVLRGLRPDVLHSHHPVGLGHYAKLSSKRLRLPLVFTFHTWYEDFSHYFSRYMPFVGEKQVGRLIRYWIGRFIRQCHQVVAPSEFARRRILGTYGNILRDEDIAVVPTGIEASQFTKYDKRESRRILGWSEDSSYLVSCGRLSREKNFDVLLDSLSKMEENAKLVILGDGDLRTSLENKARELGLSARVEFPGNVSRCEVARYFTAADAFAFASLNETQGLVVLEAMACGTPAVVVAEGGVADFVEDGLNGVTVENDPRALACALDRVLRTSDLGALRERAKATALGFTVERQTKRLSEVYSKAILKQQVGNACQAAHSPPRLAGC